jgi:Type I phosphodiesterase / nucleotide pyrophosphatase
MHIRPIRRAAAVAVSVATVLGGSAFASAASGPAGHGGASTSVGIRHVLLLSVDGMHPQDLTWYVRNHPDSVLAALDRRGVEYSRAMTPFPSDSFPGMVGQATGGDPRVTGIYYDDTWNHDVFPAGTTNCSGPVPGGEAAYTEADDIDQTALDAGQGLSGLPGSILQMTGNPLQVINPANLPVNPTTCKPIDPNQYLKVNTIFNVATDHGLRTAWSDKHPAYQALSGPSGTGVQDYFTPEINSNAIGFPAGEDWTSDNAATMEYDSFKVRAVLNWIDGLDHNGTNHAGVPASSG